MIKKKNIISIATMLIFALSTKIPGSLIKADSQSSTPGTKISFELNSLTYGAGNTVIINGTSDGSNVIVKVIGPNQNAIYYNIDNVVNGSFTDKFALKSDAVSGNYTVTCGYDTVMDKKIFTVQSVSPNPNPNPTPNPNPVPSPSSAPNPTPSPTPSATPVPTSVPGTDEQKKTELIKQTMNKFEDDSTEQAGVSALKELFSSGLSAEESQKCVEEVLTKVPNIDAPLISAAADLINNANQVKVNGTVADGKAIESSIALILEASKYADVIKTKAGDEAAKSFSSELLLNIVASEEGKVFVEPQFFAKLIGTSAKIAISGEDVKAVIPMEFIASAQESAKYIKFESSQATSAESKGLFKQAAKRDEALTGVGRVSTIELYLIGKDGRSTIASGLTAPIKISLSLSDDELAAIKDKRKACAYCINNDGTCTCMGGKLSGNLFSFDTPHCSKYAVMEYNKSFKDVGNNLWSKDYIEVLAARHITSGTDKSGKLFEPKKNVTRAEFAAFLVRALGINTTKFKGTFKDVKSDKWYAKEVEAAKSAGFIDGSGDGNFSPDEFITREAMAKMIVKAYETKSNENLNNLSKKYNGKLKDISKVSKWASDYVKAAEGLGIINGNDDGAYNPSKNAQRQEVAKVIVTLLEKTEDI